MASLLGASLETEGARIDRSGVPRSTYQDAKRRIYERGLVEDRYVPDPPKFGKRWATAIIARPYAEDLPACVERWGRSPQTVLLWRGLHTVFGFFLHTTPTFQLPSGPAGSPAPETLGITVSLSRPSVPIYFDFEGAWANLAGAPGTWQYPRPLVALPGPEVAVVSGLGRRVASDLVRRPLPGEGQPRPAHLMGPYALPRRARQLVERGILNWRVFPRISRLILSDERSVDGVVLLFGDLKEGRSPEGLFRELVVRRSFPFLLMTEGRRVLLGFLSSRSVRSSRSPTGVADALTEHLTQMVAHREPAEDLEERVCHRYESVVDGVGG